MTAQLQAAASDNALEQVVVSGIGSLLDDKLPGDPRDIPQSVTVVDSKVMAAQASTRLEDALKNVPGITLNAGEGAARGDTVNLRGFSAFNDFFLDGVRDAAVYTRDSFDLDSVEVVKGPSAILFGRGSTGGAINQVSKAPLPTALAAVGADFGSNDEYRATTDLNMPLGDAAAIRLNAMGESSQVADRDLVRNRRWGLAPSLTLGIGAQDSLTLAYLHQQQNDRPDSGIPFVSGRPAPVPRDAFYGLASDHVTAYDDIGTARYRHEFGASLALVDTLRYANYEFDYHDNMPNFGADPPSPGALPASLSVGRDAPASSGTQTNFTNQTDLIARFDTGSLSHRLVAGAEFSRQTVNLFRYLNPFNGNNGWIPETSLLNPDPYETQPIEPVSSQQYTSAHSSAAYVTDTLGLGQHLKLILGGRFDRFSADYVQLNEISGALLHLQHIDNVGSPRAALIFNPAPLQGFYFSYGTSFDPSAEALSLTTKTANLGPVKASSYELGAKSGWMGGALSINGALFHTVVDNAQTNDPENPTITTLNGNQRVNGLELGASGYLTRKLEILAGYTYLDARTISSGTAAYVGKVLPNTARNALNLWTEYELSDALEIGLGGNWLGHRFADYGETAPMPGFVVLNAMASYRINRNLLLQLNGFNLANRLYYENSYYTSVSENHVIPGAGRTVKLSIRMTF